LIILDQIVLKCGFFPYFCQIMQKIKSPTNNVDSLRKKSLNFFYEKLYCVSTSLKRVIYKLLHYLTKIWKNRRYDIARKSFSKECHSKEFFYKEFYFQGIFFQGMSFPRKVVSKELFYKECRSKDFFKYIVSHSNKFSTESNWIFTF
jgi:hypothetical protein